jgi:hypothetical protein
MRTNVTFRHFAEFVGDQEDGGGVLAVSGAHWFAALLKRIQGLQLDEDACQEDWGVVFFARRNHWKFWIGLSAWNSEGAWLAHVHHGSFAWLQRFTAAGKNELKRLFADVHDILASEPAITEIAWHEESEMSKPEPGGFPTPVEGSQGSLALSFERRCSVDQCDHTPSAAEGTQWRRNPDRQASRH